MLLALPWRTSPILRTSSLRLAAVYSPNVVEGEFYEVRIASPLYGRASYVQIREFVDPAYIRS
jgi:hypothetical protein